MNNIYLKIWSISIIWRKITGFEKRIGKAATETEFEAVWPAWVSS
jgi:hypothetical protein